MTSSALFVTAWLACCAGPAFAQGPAPAKVPFADESLSYSINWPSGLSLGEGRLLATRTGNRWSFALSLDASVPGFTISDSYSSIAAGNFCSVEFTKQYTHGKKKSHEKMTFDAQAGTATRVTVTPAGGGKTELPIGDCARDALTFLFFLRHELSQGRLPSPQTLYFGAPYQIRLEYGGSQKFRIGSRSYQADRLRASLKGPASAISFEMLFSHDKTRTPLLVSVPFSAGTFAMELVP